MKVFLLIVMIYLAYSSSLPIINGPILVFNIYRKDIQIVKLEKLKSVINLKDTDLFVNTTGVKNYIGEIDFNFRENIFLWRKTEPENALYVIPIDKSYDNLLGIKEKTLLLKLNKSISLRVSIDWIHNLVYYNEDDKIIVFNMTYTKYGFVVIRDTRNLILDLSVNPLDSCIFWSAFDDKLKKGKIMRASQDGSNQTVLIDNGIKEPIALAIDLVLRRIFWIDRRLFKFCSIDFNGNNTQTILESRELFTLSYFMDIFGDDIYWSNYFHSSILKTNKFGLNGTQINYLVKSETDAEIESIRIIDSSLQPDSTNRCIYSKCSHLCLPISVHQYRCVCPQLIYNLNTHYNSQRCTQSTHTIEDNMNEADIQTTTLITETMQNTFSTLLFEEISNSQMTVKSEELSKPSTLQSLSLDFTIDTIINNLSVRNEMLNDCHILRNSSRLQKTYYIKNYQTSGLLYVSLVISIIFNILFSFALIFQLYRRKKRQRNLQIRAQRCLAEFKPIQFEMTNNENNYLIQSNPLISNAMLARNHLNDEF